MEKNIERKSGEAIITLVASQEEWKKEQSKEFNKLKSKLKVPGFRVGQIPDEVAKGRINHAEVLENAVISLVNKFYQDTLKEENLVPVMQPRLEITKLSDEEAEARIIVPLLPVVTLGEYKGLKVALEEVKVTDEDIDRELTRLRNDHGIQQVKEDAAKLNDTVIIDFKGYVDDIPFEGGEAKEYSLKLGSNSFIPGFEDQLVGIKAGEERTITVKFPDNYVQNLASKEAKFEIKCHEVKETIIPELNEDFVKELDYQGVDTIDQLKEKVTKDLEAKKTRQASDNRLNKIIQTIVDSSKVEMSSLIVEDEVNAEIENAKHQIESNGLSFEDYLKAMNLTMEQYRQNVQANANAILTRTFVIDEICRKENIVVDSKALNDKYAELAKMYSMKVEDIKEALKAQQNELLRQIRSELFTKFILENNKD